MSGYYELKRSGDQYMFNLKAGIMKSFLRASATPLKLVLRMASRLSARIHRSMSAISARRLPTVRLISR